MSKIKYIKTIGLLAAVAFVPAVGNTAQISYQFSGTWTDSPSAPFADTYVVNVVVDNGGTSAVSQVYQQADFVSLSAVSGTFDVVWTDSDIGTWHTNLATNASGQMNTGYVDFNFEPSPPDEWFTLNLASNRYTQACTTSVRNNCAFDMESSTSSVGQVVPIPAAAWLFGSGLLGLAGIARRKKTV